MLLNKSFYKIILLLIIPLLFHLKCEDPSVYKINNNKTKINKGNLYKSTTWSFAYFSDSLTVEKNISNIFNNGDINDILILDSLTSIIFNGVSDSDIVDELNWEFVEILEWQSFNDTITMGAFLVNPINNLDFLNIDSLVISFSTFIDSLNKTKYGLLLDVNNKIVFSQNFKNTFCNNCNYSQRISLEKCGNRGDFSKLCL